MRFLLSKPDFVKEVYRTALKMISIADAKANLSITVQSLIFSIGLGATLASDVLNILPSIKPIYFWLFIVLSILLICGTIIGIICSLLVYFDRIRKSKRKIINLNKWLESKRYKRWAEKIRQDPYLLKGVGNFYFKHILVTFPDVDDYINNILDGFDLIENANSYEKKRIDETRILLTEYALSIHSISKTLAKKFIFVNSSIILLVCNLFLAAFLAIANGVILLVN